MVDALIFSKDRPAQLDLLLRSIEWFAPNLYSSLTVQYTYSGSRFAQGYDLCRDRHTDVRWRPEAAGSFERELRGWLHGVGWLISFLVDDDVLYQRPTYPQFLGVPYSLRSGDYNYPFSLDGNVYDKSTILPLIESVRGWRNPTVLEAGMHELRERLPFRVVSAMLPPCLVGVPANRVSEHSGMPHMNVSPVWLNERFLAGDRIDLERTTQPLREGLLEPAPHVELRYVFESEHPR